MSPIRFLSLCLVLVIYGQLPAQCFVTAGNGGYIRNSSGTDSVGYLTSLSSTALMINLGSFTDACGFTFPGLNAPWSGNTDGVLSTVTYNFSKPVKSLEMLFGFVGLNGVTAPESFVIQTDGETPLLTVDAGACSAWVVSGDTIYSPDIPNAINAMVGIEGLSSFTNLTISTYSTSIGITANGGASYAFCKQSFTGCTATTDSIEVQSCGSYLSPGGKLLTASGDYLDTLSSVAGCDSIIAIKLDITEPVSASISWDLDHTLSAELSGYEYQWLNCDSDFYAIPGANDQVYTVLESGSYAVVMSTGSCKDTSNCILVDTEEPTVGLSSYEVAGATIYPNPVSEYFYLDGLQEQARIELYALDGSLIFTQLVDPGNAIQLPAEVQSAAYLLRIRLKQKVISRYLQVIR